MSKQAPIIQNGQPAYREGSLGAKLFALFDEKRPNNQQEAIAFAVAAAFNENSAGKNFYQWRRFNGQAQPAAYKVYISKDEDEKYRLWLKTHPQGYVLNSYRSPIAKYLVLHRAWCSSIQNTIGDDYLKVCADSEEGLWQWLNENGFEAFSKEGHSCNKQSGVNGEQKIKGSTDMTTPTPIALNQILFGPPGTGKTFNTVNKALEILDADFLKDNSEDRISLKGRFDDFIEDESIVFCTFHQSFSYEDFVEGLRAILVNGQIEYRVEPGVFKKICESAVRSISGDLISESFESDASIDEALKRFIAQVSDKSMTLKTQRGQTFYVGHKSGDKGFHCALEASPDLYIAQPSIEHIRKILSGVDSDIDPCIDTPYASSIAEYIKKQLVGDEDFSDKSTNMGDVIRKPYVLIIDEINRGNISKIFGELITLIEFSKRTGRDEALSVMLPYSKESFSVPDNVYLIGTMNTADRSLASLDIALRRRFEFVEMPPRPDLLDSTLVSGVNIGELLQVMNERIEVLLGYEHCLGHAYFMALRENPSIEVLADIFRLQIIPLLREYFFEDWQRISWVLNDQRKIIENRFLTQPKTDLLKLFGDEEGSKLLDERWQINEGVFNRIEAYLGVIDHELKVTPLAVRREIEFDGYTITQLKNGSIRITGIEEGSVLSKLREIAELLQITLQNGKGNVCNNIELGAKIINAIDAKNAEDTAQSAKDMLT